MKIIVPTCKHVIVGKIEISFSIKDTLALSKPVHNEGNVIFKNPIPVVIAHDILHCTVQCVVMRNSLLI